MVPNPPVDMPRITPHLFYDDVAAAMDWLVNAFGFEVRLRMTDKDGGVVHGELELADSLVMLGLTAENDAWASPQSHGGRVSERLYVFVDNVDAHYERSRSAGANPQRARRSFRRPRLRVRRPGRASLEVRAALPRRRQQDPEAARLI